LHPIGLIGSFSQTLSDCEEKFKKISPIILRHEGRYVNDPVDPGGATNMGVAWPTWKSYAKSDLGIEPTLENLKALTQHQAEIIYFKRYWKPKGFCDLKNIKTALMIYDWTITSGKAVREVQKVLVNEFGKIVTIDNTMGRKTIDAINSIMDQEYLGQRISESRKSYYTSLTVNRDGTTNAKIKFLKGWHNRVDDCLRALP
ncbi:glycoside hydrolase family 108 protein, partial [Metapseudomonas furukawaii]